MQSQCKPRNRCSSRLHAFICEAVTEAVKIALDEAKAAEQKTADVAPTPARPARWFELSDSISAEMAK